MEPASLGEGRRWLPVRESNGLGMSWCTWGPFYAEWWGHGGVLWIGRLRLKAEAKVWWSRV